MNMRLAPARLPASSGLGCGLAAGSDGGCMPMSGAGTTVGAARRCCPARGPSGASRGRGLAEAGAAGGQVAAVPGGRESRPSAAAGGAHRRLRGFHRALGAGGYGQRRRVRRAADLGGSRTPRERGTGRCLQALCQNRGPRKLEDEDEGGCQRAPHWSLVRKRWWQTFNKPRWFSLVLPVTSQRDPEFFIFLC